MDVPVRQVRAMMPSMNARAQKVLSEAMELTSSERADLVHRLIRSLEGEPDPDAEVLWQKEIERRALEAVRGESPGCDVDVVMADVRQRLRRV